MLGLGLSLTKALSVLKTIIRDGLRMWLPFSKDGSDSSGNSNNATLYTGKALSFDGTNDYVDLGSQSNPATNMTFACWLNPVVSASTGLQSIIDYGKFLVQLDDNDTLVIYTDTGETAVNYTISDLNNKWSRLVVSVSGTTTSVYIDGTLIAAQTTPALSDIASQSDIGRDETTRYYEGKLSDLQIYDVAWSQADVTFDYNNPQHLVTDNSASSIALSNLKGYWHLSEGAGSFAYNSAVALGSELVTGWTNSDFDSFTSSGSNITQMVSGASGDNCYSNSLTVTSGKTYKVEFTSSQNLSTNCQVRVSANTILTSTDVVSSSVSEGLNTFVFTATGNRAYIGFYAAGSFTDTQITNFSFKEVSVGAINGATASPQQATIPQLGLIDWSKPTIGSDEITLISDPNDPSKDILDNDVRLREHGLNLDGSGYAEVADDDTINPTSAITVACWVYWNETLSNGTRTNDIGIVSKWKSGTEDYMLYKGTDTTFDFYIGTDSERSNDLGMDTPGWVYIAGTYDGSTIKTYKNGVSNSSGTSVSRTIPNTAQVLEIGRYRETVDRSYPERIDEVKIYNRALSADELLQNYNAGLSQHKPGSAFSDDFSSDYGL
jgi:hypothetical protein